jgi:periplasmic copper chaperone A
MMRSTRLIASVLLAVASIAAEAGDISIGDPYARAVPPGQPNSAVFMSLKNASGTDRALVAAASPAAKTVELHTHVNENGVMKMRKIERIDLPAGKTVALKPGGLHVMLIGLNGALTPGASVDLTLVYDDGTKAQIAAPVREIGTKPAQH